MKNLQSLRKNFIARAGGAYNAGDSWQSEARYKRNSSNLSCEPEKELRPASMISRGFTLIEMLVVVAIITIVGMLTFPSATAETYEGYRTHSQTSSHR